MDDRELSETMQDGFELLCMFSRNIALLPLEDWLRALNKAETVGAILDPTLYRKYLWSDKAKVLKELIEAAIPLKKTVLASQEVAGRR